MKTLFLSLILACWSVGAAMAQMGAGADNFSLATTVPAEGGRSAQTDLLTCTQQLGEPVVSPAILPNTAWWRWTAVQDGFCVVDTLATSVDYDAKRSSAVAVYTGTSVGNLTRVASGEYYRSHASADTLGAATRFYAKQGQSYYFQVSSYYLSATYRYVLLSVRTLPSKLLQKDAVFIYTRSDGKRDMGALTVMLNPLGTLTGKLRLRSGTYSFSTVVDQAGMAAGHVLQKAKRGELPQPPISLHMTCGYDGSVYFSFPGTPSLSAYFYDAIPAVDVLAGAWSGISQAAGINAPFSMNVKPNKMVSIATRAPDGTAITMSSRIVKSPYVGTLGGLTSMKFLKNDGSFRLSPYFIFGPGYSMHGEGTYILREKPDAIFYPAGLIAGINLEVFPFTKPVKGQRALGFLNATAGAGKLRVIDPDGELGGNMDLPLTLDSNNKFVFAADPMRKPTLKLNIATGQVTGTVILAGKKRNILGSLSDPAGPSLVGYITGTTRNVRFTVIP